MPEEQRWGQRKGEKKKCPGRTWLSVVGVARRTHEGFDIFIDCGRPCVSDEAIRAPHSYI